jgi:putative ABC transport system ATP-binding protein
MSKILELEGVSKSYIKGKIVTEAVKNVTYTLNKEESLSIIGPSGSGKTTLLNLIGGLDKPTSGKVIIDGHDITKLNDKKLSQFRNKTIGFVFQFFNLQDYLTATENVMTPLLFGGVKRSTAEAKALELLKKVGLEKRAKYYPHQLSGGEMQRVAIARAIVTQPALLLADEPSGNLDAETGEMVMNLIFDLVSTNRMTLVLVTHNLDLAKRCQRQISLRNGRIE